MKTNLISLKPSQGISILFVLGLLLAFSVLIVALGTRGLDVQNLVNLKSKREIAEQKANANYQRVMSASIQMIARAMALCSGETVIPPAPFLERAFEGREAELQAIEDNLRLGGASCDTLDPAYIAGAHPLGEDWRFSLQGRDVSGDMNDFPKPFLLQVIQQTTDGLSVTVSGQYEIVQRDLSDFSALAFSMNSNPKIISAGEHGTLGFFAATTDPLGNPIVVPQGDEPCRADETTGQLKDYAMYLLPPEGETLKVDTIVTNMPERVCAGYTSNHVWGPIWGHQILHGGEVTVTTGIITSASPVDDLRSSLTQTYYATLQAQSSGGGGGGGGSGGGGGMTCDEGCGSYVGEFSAHFQMPTQTLGDEDIYGGSAQISYAEFWMGCDNPSDPASCKIGLDEVLTNGSRRHVVPYQAHTPGKVVATSAQRTVIRRHPSSAGDSSSAYLGENNFMLLSYGDIELAQSIRRADGIPDHPSDPQKGGLATFVSITKSSLKLTPQTKATNGDTLATIKQSGLNGLEEGEPSVLIEAGSIALNDLALKVDAELLNTQSGGNNLLGLLKTAGPLWGSDIPQIRLINDNVQGDGTEIVAGFEEFNSSYPPAWQNNPGTAIETSSLLSAREIGRSVEIENFEEAVAEARRLLGL